MNFHIRKALVEDAIRCAEIHIQAWQETYRGIIPDSYLDSANLDKRIKMWEKIIEDHQLFSIVAEIEDIGVVGYLTAGKNRSPQFSGYGEIMGIYLLKNYHHKGIGQALFNTGLRLLKEQGQTKVSLWVLKDNPTCDFYLKMKGQEREQQEIDIAGKKLVELAYVWETI